MKTFKELLAELSKKTLGSYVKKAVEQVNEVSAKAKRAHAAERAEIERDYRQRPMTSSPKYKKDGTKARDMWDGGYEEGRSKKRTPSGGMGGGTG
jgi:hypothetical protein